MLEKSWILCFSNRVLGESKGRVVKPAGAESCGQRRNQKLHAARSTFSSESTSAPRTTFWRFRCRKIARRCGEKGIFKWRCAKHVSFGALFEVPMSKNCTPLWREAHFQIKMLKDWRSRSTFWSSDVEKLHAAVARSTCVSQNVQNACVLAHFFKFRCRKISQLASSSVNQSVR